MHIQKLPEIEVARGRFFMQLIMHNQPGEFIDFFHVRLWEQTSCKKQEAKKEGRNRFHAAKIRWK